MSKLTFIQREMVLAHKRNAWDTVLWLAVIARKLRTNGAHYSAGG